MTDTVMTQKSTIDGRMRDEEIMRRLPEIELIEDEEIRKQTRDALARGTPDYFWKVPATSSGYYHNTYSKGKHGLWIHVKMGVTAYERMVRSYVEQGLISEKEADMGRAAMLLHDMLKYGHKYESGDHTRSNHDVMAGMWVGKNTDLPTPVVRAVERHNGPWYDGPTPEPDDHLSQLVHMADMVASTKNATCGLYKPAEEIAERYPDVPRADL